MPWTCLGCAWVLSETFIVTCLVGVYYNEPKFKNQLLSGTGWFSYKIWTKNSKTPMVNLLKNLRPFWNYNFKIQREIHFFNFFIVGRNTSPKKFRIEICTFSFQICFRNQFWTLGSGQTENTQICVFAFFSVWPLPKVQNLFQKQIWNENVHNSILKKNFEEFRPISKKVKKRISHCILKL